MGWTLDAVQPARRRLQASAGAEMLLIRCSHGLDTGQGWGETRQGLKPWACLLLDGKERDDPQEEVKLSHGE